MQRIYLLTCLTFFLGVSLGHAADGPIAHWPLQGDGRDRSGNDLHAANHGVDLATGRFDGRGGYLEVADSPRLDFGKGDFSIVARVAPDETHTDADGDIVTKFDPASRTGFTLSLGASGSGYNGPGDARRVTFGVDNGGQGVWSDCGRPGGKSHNSDALTVFRGELYAGVSDGPDVADWAHVFRYRGGQDWEDCGRLGDGRTRGVYAMTVHNGDLYAATSASHGPQPATMSFGRVYRYRSGTDWEDVGQPGENYRINALASFAGKLYACGFNIGPALGHVYVFEPADPDKAAAWKPIGEFDGWPHTLAVHDGELFMAYPRGEVFAYDGKAWRELDNPFGTREQCNQIHSLGVFGGELLAGTWPKGRIAALRDGKWVDLGIPGDATEVIALTPYNGTLYAGSIPRAEVFRLDFDHHGATGWKSVRKLFDPAGFEPVPVGSTDWQGVADWSRASSLAVFGDKLFATTATCHRTMLEAPREDEARGGVFAFQTGGHVSYDHDLSAGWKNIAAVRAGDQLQLFIDGMLAATSTLREDLRDSMDVSNSAPLQIGFGPTSHFAGQIGDVRLFDRALTAEEIAEVLGSR